MSNEVKNTKAISMFASITTSLVERLERKGKKSTEAKALSIELETVLKTLFMNTLGDSSNACESVLLEIDMAAARGAISKIKALEAEHNDSK